MRNLPSAILLALPIALASHTAVAQGAPTAAQDTGDHACVDVEVNGKRLLSYECLSRMMAATNTPAPPVLATDDPRTWSSNKVVGQYNFSALEHRMGSNLGVSVQPFRPKLSYPSPLTSGK